MGNTTTESIAAATSAADVGVDMCPPATAIVVIATTSGSVVAE